MHIRVGIKTLGEPILIKEESYTILKNMLIGDGFHWEKSLEVRLPGEISGFQAENSSEAEKGSDNLSGQNVTLINTLPLEKYLECVVGSEMNPSAPIEFLKAHAVISRTWALGKVTDSHDTGKTGWENNREVMVGWDDTGQHCGFHVCSDDHCQRYQGLQPIDPVVLSALKETENEVLFDKENNLLDTRFSKCCGGVTEIFSTCWQNSDNSCLKSLKDPWCDLSRLNQERRRAILASFLKDYDLETQNYGFRWEAEINKAEIKKNLKLKFGRDIGEIETIKVIHRGPSGRIDKIEINGSEGELVFGKELWIRRLLSPSHLYSSAFEIENHGETLKLKGRGWGHGVGLCQIGAANMAANGYDYKQILSFYYPGSRLIKMG